MTTHTVSSSRQSTEPPIASENEAADGAPNYDLRPYLWAARQELEAALFSYQGAFPDSLMEMGKFALSGQLKLFALPDTLEDVITSSIAPWPLCVLLSCKTALGCDNRKAWRQALPAAVAVEIAMAAADLLDELTDDDPSPFVRRYGRGQALNTSNLMLVMAQQLLQRDAQGEGGQRAILALGALQDMLTHAALGQHLDMLYSRMGIQEVTLEMSVRMTELKAGALVSGACRIGALMAGADERVVELLARFGQQKGSIAQLINDVQDVMPDSETGDGEQPEAQAEPERKTDLRLHKRTLPIVFTLREDLPYPNALQRAFAGDSCDSMEAADEEGLRHAIIQAGGVQFTNLVIEVHRQNAVEALNELETLRPGAREALRPLLSE